MIGRINRIEILDAIYGHDMRVAVLLQGCDLRCICCQTPETWDYTGGEEISAKALVEKFRHYQDYFGAHGGIVVTGGEPLLQAEFVEEVFKRCKEIGIHTEIDTSGSVCSAAVLRVLDYVDLVLLDLKYTTREDYRTYVNGSLRQTLRFLNVLQVRKIPVWLNQSIVPGLNDDDENLNRLADIVNGHSCIERVQLHPFQTICAEKYEQLNIPFPLRGTPQLDGDTMERLNRYLKERISIYR
ncbi:radical SAM protein [Oscillospiraceae bacterium PP1C4]